MVVLTLLIFGLWLIVLVIHFEIRKREIEEFVIAQQGRHQEARRLIEVFQEGLESVKAAPEDQEELEPLILLEDDGDAGDSSRSSELLDPTPAQIAALVSPRLEETDLPTSIYAEVQNVARENPDLATAAIRRLIEQDHRSKSSRR